MPFFLSFVFGAAQACLTERLVKAFEIRNNKNILLFFAIKFILYAIGIGFVIFKYVWHLGVVFCGFVVGVPIAAIAIFCIKNFVINKRY